MSLTQENWAASWQNQQCGMCAYRKTQISMDIRPVWSVYSARMKKAWILSYPFSAQRRLWSDWADAQADLNLRWTHINFVGFVTRRLDCTIMFQSFRTDRSGQTVQTRIRLLLISVYIDCNSLCIFWMHYSKQKPSCLTFRVIIAYFWVSKF